MGKISDEDIDLIISLDDNLDISPKRIKKSKKLICKNIDNAIDVWEEENKKYKKFSLWNDAYRKNRKYIERLREMKNRNCKN
jgi:hypothetical protein